MVSSLFYLTSRTAWNRFRNQLRRIRQPRYVIALAVGIAYFWFFLLRPGEFSTEANPFRVFTTDVGTDLATAALFLLFASAWIFGRRGDALAFSPAEVHFLFPAPLSRRWLVAFKLARTQIAILLSTFIWTLLVRRGAGDLHPLARALGFWILFATISMHQLGAAIVHVWMIRTGAFAGLRQILVSAGLFSISALYSYAAYTAWQTAAAAGVQRTDFFRVAAAMLDQPLLGTLLEPFRILGLAALAPSLGEWQQAMPFAVLIFAIHIVVLFSLRVSFEESAAEASTRIAKRVAEFRAGRFHTRERPSATAIRGTRIPLAPAGTPAMAIVWKNALAFLRQLKSTSPAMAAVMLVPLGVALVLTVDASMAVEMIAAIAGMFLFWSILLGPRMIRNDLRSDLAQLSVLKTFPLSGATIVGAEVASATLALTCLQMIPVLTAFIVLSLQNEFRILASDRYLLLAAAPVCLGAINAINLSIHNGATLMFPAWMTLGPNRPTGVEAMGQGLLLTLGSIILLAIALIPAAIVTTAGFFVTITLPLRMQVAILVIAATAVLFAEVFMAMQLLGRLFERTEPAALT